MQKNSDRKSGAILSALLLIIVALLFASIIVLVIPGINNVIAIGFLLLYVAVILTVIIGILVALFQRLKELKNGEAEEAKKY